MMKKLDLLKLIGHICFWIGYLFVLINLSQLVFPLYESIFRATMILIMHIVMVYVNILYLVPHYLEQKKFFAFSLFIILFVVIISTIRFLFIEPFFFQEEKVKKVVDLDILSKLIFTSFPSVILLIISTIYALAKKRWVLQKENLQAELKLLREQINPHFLFNTLNNIYVLAYEKSSNAAPMILKLSEMMRYAYHDCETEKVLLEKEIAYIHNFIDLYQLRFEKNRNINFAIKGSADGMLIAPLLFNPLMENTIKYSDLDENISGFIDIEVNAVQGESIEFKISNSCKKKKETIIKGIGLQNLQRRLELIYPGKHILNIIEQSNIFTAKMIIQTK